MMENLCPSVPAIWKAIWPGPRTGIFRHERKAYKPESLTAINEDGADVIVLGSTTLHQSYGYLKERLPVPVINPGLVMYKLCEVFLELGLSHSKQAFPTPQALKDDEIFSRLAVAKS